MGKNEKKLKRNLQNKDAKLFDIVNKIVYQNRTK